MPASGRHSKSISPPLIRELALTNRPMNDCEAVVEDLAQDLLIPVAVIEHGCVHAQRAA